MKTTIQAAAAAITLIASSAAHAQEAVQWKVSDGGNGHWYQLRITGPLTWGHARLYCESLGGYLATPTGPQENALLVGLAADPAAWVADCCGNTGGPWLGGYQPVGANPDSPWRWVTGEPWGWTGWAAGEPNNGFQPGVLVTVMLGYPPVATNYRGWADGYAAGSSPSDPIQYPLVPSCLVEWSADCNGDGIVDYGQILDGTFPDANGNGVPDCCDGGGSCTPCSGDVASDGMVDGVDLAAVLSQWGTQGSGTFNADIDDSGLVDGGDLALVLGGWGPCPP